MPRLAFLDFVLRGGRESCLDILEADLRRGGAGPSVGELQGGSDDHPIHRVPFPPSSSEVEEIDGIVTEEEE